MVLVCVELFLEDDGTYGYMSRACGQSMLGSDCILESAWEAGINPCVQWWPEMH